MEQRQLRLGDTLDDYCPRERRLTNHAVVAMVGADVKQTRCTTCDAEHDYKHAKLPRLRRKSDSPAALYAQVAANAPKRVTVPQAASPPLMNNDEHADDIEVDKTSVPVNDGTRELDEHADDPQVQTTLAPEDDRLTGSKDGEEGEADEREEREDEEGPVHRPLIRASLTREGQPPPTRPIPEFTIRQPGGRASRFHPRHQGGQPFQGNRSNGGGPGGQQRTGGPRHGGGRPPQGAMPSRLARRHGPGRMRSK